MRRWDANGSVSQAIRETRQHSIALAGAGHKEEPTERSRVGASWTGDKRGQGRPCYANKFVSA